MPTQLFSFVQVEVPWSLGPADGRYVLRGHAGEPAYVLVVRTLGAPPAAGGPVARWRRSRPRAAASGAPPTPVLVTRATLIAARALDVPGEHWLRECDPQALVAEAIAVLNDVVQAYRVATADPGVRPLTREQALVARVGVGAGEEVAEGRWSRAVEVPAPHAPRRVRERRREERLAAILAVRDVALACEELTLRARADFDAGRRREAALQLRAAYEAALAELTPWAGLGDIEARLDELRELQPAADEAARRALLGGVGDEPWAAASHALERLEAALRARAYLAAGA
ncbi:MAG: hypothetical protein LT070_12520 [Solirubrobacteraceae bacterium]|nr:hypothetical protein [Solirubrobacteraceae bacterium]